MIGLNTSNKNSNKEKGDFEQFIERNNEFIENQKFKKRLKSHVQRSGTNHKQKMNILDLHSVSSYSKKREPISHIKGVFNLMLNKRRQETSHIPLFNPENYEYNSNKRRFDDNNSEPESPDHRRFSLFPSNLEKEGFRYD